MAEQDSLTIASQLKTTILISFILCQYSAYIMDERFPSVPMLKCDHMMQSPPIFCDVIPGSVFSGSAEDGAKTTKVLLGSHSSQEITMLQYSGQLMGVVRALPTKPWVHFWLIYLPKVKSSKYVSILVSGTEPEGSWDRTDICIKPCVCVCRRQSGGLFQSRSPSGSAQTKGQSETPSRPNPSPPGHRN